MKRPEGRTNSNISLSTSSPPPDIPHNHSNRSSVHSFSDIKLTAKPHAFSGSILNPKHARELTPKLVLSITHTLGAHALESSNTFASSGPNSTSTDSGGGANYYPTLSSNNTNDDGPVEAKVQYTVWITEAWRVLGWAEPSAALFWEMATMYHTLHVAARSVQVEELTAEDLAAASSAIYQSHSEDQEIGSIQRTFSRTIPPILSCGSSASMDSTDLNPKPSQHYKKNDTITQNSNAAAAAAAASPIRKLDKKHAHHKQSAASAKELPVWIIGTFLLLHCEEKAFQKNVSGEEEQRFGALMAKNSSLEIFGFGIGAHNSSILSMDAKLHNASFLNHSNCTSFLLRHLRKFLLLACVPHNSDALIALVQLADSACVHDIEYTIRQDRKASKNLDKYTTSDPDVLLRRHDDEHGDVGFNVHMTVDDLERLNLILQAPFGGRINDPALYISDFMPQEELAVYGGISLEIIEQELRRHLENDLLDSNDNNSQDDKTASDVLSDIGNLSLDEKKEDADNDRNEYKELSYTKIRGSTVYLHPKKPVQRDMSPDGSLMNGGRLHDVQISGCSDAHLYLLQPFEHATISACYGCTIVVGAVAGLLDVVDCERCTVTGAARRVLVSNCYDVTMSIFTPSPPLLCGDNRNCQFAPYNTYYDGLRDDLLSTGLAAVLVSTDNSIVSDPLYGPALQCASNKWKIPVELSKLSDLLHAPQSVPRSSSPVLGASADEKQISTDDTVKISTLVPASDFNVLIIPFASKLTKERHRKQEAKIDDVDAPGNIKGSGMGAQYCHNLADVIQLCPFRLPTEYERMVLAKADRIKSLQHAIETELTPEHQVKLAEELNQGFRDWLVTSGNLRQILDLVHLDHKSN